MAKPTTSSTDNGSTPATVALHRHGVDFVLHPYHHEGGTVSFGDEAAAALGVAPQRLLKTLVAAVESRWAVALVPVAGQLDLKALASAVGAKRAELADPADAERVTGYVRGGISPFGQRRQLRTVVDASALEHSTVYVSAGRRGLQVELTPADLVRVTQAAVVAISRR